MKKLLAGGGVALVASLSLLSAAAPAFSYPDEGAPGGTTTVPDGLGGVEGTNGNLSGQGSPAADSGLLPSTGGPAGDLLLGGAALSAVGVAAVATARRRRA